MCKASRHPTGHQITSFKCSCNGGRHLSSHHGHHLRNHVARVTKTIHESINQSRYKIHTNGVHPRHVINRPGRKMLITRRVRKNSHSSPTVRSHLATYVSGTKTIVGKIGTAKDTLRSLTKYLVQILESLRIDVHYVFRIT